MEILLMLFVYKRSNYKYIKLLIDFSLGTIQPLIYIQQKISFDFSTSQNNKNGICWPIDPLIFQPSFSHLKFKENFVSHNKFERGVCVDVADKNIKMPSRNVFRSTNEIGIFFNGYSFAVTRVNTNESCMCKK